MKIVLLSILFPASLSLWDSPWAPCSTLITTFSTAAMNMAACALRHAAPPAACLHCHTEFDAMRTAYMSIVNSNISTADNRTLCSGAYLNEYAESYVNLLHEAIHGRLWDDSYCQNCIVFNGTEAQLTPNAHKYKELEKEFAECKEAHEGGLICSNCWESYDALYRFYWNDYSGDPEADFCVDIQVSVLSAILFLLTAAFYIAAGIWGKQERRRIKRYRRIIPPPIDDDPRLQGDEEPLHSPSSTAFPS